MHKRINLKNILYLCVILLLVLVIVFSGIQILEKTVFREQQEPYSSYSSKTIVRDGVSYFPRQDITVIMALGIDEFGEVQSSGSYNNSGAADMVTLLVLDHKDKVCNILCLNRDTMVEMPVLGIGGKQAGTYYGQLALSHTYGTGLEDSCENTKKTVSDFLYGITIDHYVAMNMDAISILNDAVGGVAVTVEDDFSEVDPTITMGEVVLRGEQAIHFVRTRYDVGDQLNISRIERQKEYMDGFFTALRAQQNEDAEFVVSAYNQVSPYVVTDCSANTISSLMSRYADYPLGEIVSPDGENIVADGYYQYRVDEEALDQLVLKLFYTPIDS